MKKPLFLVRVSGESMWPSLKPGRFYLASGWLKIKLGDAVVFRNSQNFSQIIVKQVKKINDQGYWVDGLVSWSSSSQDFGNIKENQVLGRIIAI